MERIKLYEFINKNFGQFYDSDNKDKNLEFIHECKFINKQITSIDGSNALTYFVKNVDNSNAIGVTYINNRFNLFFTYWITIITKESKIEKLVTDIITESNLEDFDISSILDKIKKVVKLNKINFNQK